MAGTIVRKGDNKWLVRIFLGRDAEGRTRHANKTIHGSKKDAQKYLTARLRERDLGRYVEPTSESLRSYLKGWLADVAKPRVRPVTLESYEWLIDKHIVPALGAQRLCDLRPDQVQRFYGVLIRQGLSPRTVRYIHSVLSSALNHAEMQGMISFNPVKRCTLPKKQKTEMKYLSPEQVRAFLTAASGCKHFLFFLAAIELGLRPGELLALQWKDLDLAEWQVTVRRTVKTKKGGGFYYSTPKTSKSNRSITLSNRLVTALKNHRNQQLAAKMKVRNVYRENDLVFANEIGDPLLLENIRRRHFQHILVKAGIEKIRIYDLRHTSATLLLAANEHPKVVAERLGHSSTNLTLDVYSHVLPGMQRSATEKIEKLMFGT